MNEEIVDTVGMQECLDALEKHFEECKRERAVFAAMEQFQEEWSTIVEALLCPANLRTPYQALVVEECEEVMAL